MSIVAGALLSVPPLKERKQLFHAIHTVICTVDATEGVERNGTRTHSQIAPCVDPGPHRDSCLSGYVELKI